MKKKERKAKERRNGREREKERERYERECSSRYKRVESRKKVQNNRNR